MDFNTKLNLLKQAMPVADPARARRMLDMIGTASFTPQQLDALKGVLTEAKVPGMLHSTTLEAAGKPMGFLSKLVFNKTIKPQIIERL